MIAEKQQIQKTKICKFQVNGKCKFGEHCRFSHNIFKIFVMRHGQSLYNRVVEDTNEDFASEEAKKIYQFEPKYVDTPLTDKTFQQQFINMPSQFYVGKGIYQVDAIFVSPMRRTLETTRRLIQTQNLKAHKIIIHPDLTQVFSKICDISSPIQEKMNQFKQFDYQLMLDKYPQDAINWWQDELLDDQYKQMIDRNQISYLRYKNILEKVFPQSMQSYNRCLQRTIKCLRQIKKISQQQKWQKVFIISHNRILRYTLGIVGKQPGSQPIRLANCQIRTAYI